MWLASGHSVLPLEERFHWRDATLSNRSMNARSDGQERDGMRVQFNGKGLQCTVWIGYLITRSLKYLIMNVLIQHPHHPHHRFNVSFFSVIALRM